MPATFVVLQRHRGQQIVSAILALQLVEKYLEAPLVEFAQKLDLVTILESFAQDRSSGVK